MPARTLQGDLNCFVPAFVDFDLGNVFGSNPDYDEAFGPPRDDCFVPIDEVPEEWGSDESYEEYWDRILADDPEDQSAAPKVEVERRAIPRVGPPIDITDYDPSLFGKPELWVDYSDDLDYTQPTLGAVKIERKKTVTKVTGMGRHKRVIRERINVSFVVAVAVPHQAKRCMREPLAPCATKPGKLSLHR